MMVLLQVAIALAIIIIFAPLLPPMLEYYEAYCEWVWEKMRVR